MTAHALLSASSAEKWIHCTPSAKMEAQFSDNAGESAREGTLAHELAEIKAKKYFEQIKKSSYTRAYNRIKERELFSKDMDRYTDDYLDYLKDIEASMSNKTHTAFEVRSDFSAYVPEGFGTIDCLMIGGDVLHIVDFKYGKMIRVDVQYNHQLILYALGTLQRYNILYNFKTVTLHIVQPRMQNMESWSISKDELMGYAEQQIKPAAQQAFAGEGECKAGEWCDSHFCKARAVCRAYMGRMDEIEPYLHKDSNLLSSEEIGKALALAKDIKKWYTLLENYAQNALLSGVSIPGWKLVEGRSTRVFKDTGTAYQLLTQLGVDKALLYKQVPVTLTECERIIGKKEFEELLKDYIIKPPGKPTLVLESDPREPFSPAAADFKGLEAE